MKSTKLFVLIVIFLLSPILSYSQNTLLLTSGKKINIGEYKLTENSFLAYKNKKGKLKSIQINEVFSITDKLGSENVIYKVDNSDSEAFKIDQMRNFVQGENDAINKYKSPWTFIGGIVVGGGSFAGLNPLYAPLFPAAYSSSVGLIKVKTKKLGIEKQYLENEHYVLGFEKVAKQKRIKNSLFGSGIGIVVGLTTALLLIK